MITDKLSPKISVVMSIYNEPEEWLKESIESILNQTYSNFEFIIVNDNPDRIENKILLKKIQDFDNRIIVLHNEKNIGLTKSLNKGLEAAKGIYIARMDGDDISLPDRFEKQIEYMQNNPKIVACGSFIKIFGKKNKTDCSLPITPNEFENILFIKNPLPHPTAFIRSEFLNKYSLKYDETLVFSQDYGLWCDISRNGNLSNVPEILLKYRVQNNQISFSNKTQQLFCANNVRKRLLCDEMRKNNIDKHEDIEKIYSQFYSILEKSHKRSYILLLLSLSFPRYNFKRIIVLFSDIHLSIIIKHFNIILRRVLFPKKYPKLI